MVLLNYQTQVLCVAAIEMSSHVTRQLICQSVLMLIRISHITFDHYRSKAVLAKKL